MWAVFLSTAIIAIQVTLTPGRQCVLTGPMKNYNVGYAYGAQFLNRTLEWCIESCRDNALFKCISLDYDKKEKLCRLNRVDRNSIVLKQKKRWLYYELDCGERHNCEVIGPFEGYISGHDHMVISGMSTMEDCYQRCLDEQRMHCKSVDYNPDQGKCILSLADRSSEWLHQGGGWYYFEVQCPRKQCLMKNRVDDHKIKGAGNELFGLSGSFFKKISLDSCIKKCEDVTSFNCKSITYSSRKKTCKLSLRDRHSDKLRYQKDMIYYEMDCRDKGMTKYECPMQGRLEGYGIRVRAHQIEVKDVSEEQCMEACEKTVLMHCDSVDYNPYTKECYLSRLDRSEVVQLKPTNMRTNNIRWVYRERQCKFDVCQLQLDEGVGDKDQPRFYYNVETDSCDAFTFGGRGGNGNNFKERKTCFQTCKEKCTLPVERGDGSQKPGLLRHFYSPGDNSCIKFKWTGGPSNANHFMTKLECVSACKTLKFTRKK